MIIMNFFKLRLFYIRLACACEACEGNSVINYKYFNDNLMHEKLFYFRIFAVV